MGRDYRLYAERKLGLPARPVLRRYARQILKQLIDQHKKTGKDIIVTEFGFNHGNDSRFICRILYEQLGDKGWKFYAYDHKDYYMPENLYYGIEEDTAKQWKKCIISIPCKFETLTDEELPEYISFCYSYMALTLCEGGFQGILEKIMNRMEKDGVLVCALHSYTEKDESFETYERLCGMLRGEWKMLSDEKTRLFHNCTTLVKNDDSLCDFVFISHFNGKNECTIAYDLVV